MSYAHTHIPAGVDARLVQAAVAFDTQGLIPAEARRELLPDGPNLTFLREAREAGVSTLSTLRDAWRWHNTPPEKRGCPS